MYILHISFAHPLYISHRSPYIPDKSLYIITFLTTSWQISSVYKYNQRLSTTTLEIFGHP